MNRFVSRVLKLFLCLNLLAGSASGTVAGGRPNTISSGHNAFAGVVNPANAVWIKDRFDVGVFLVHQRLSLNNRNGNPLFLPGKTDQTYKAGYLSTADAAIHKRGKFNGTECSISLAAYTTPGYVKVRTKKPIPLIGNTPLLVEDKTQVISSIFSVKLNKNHSIGFSLDYFRLSRRRNGFQNSDNSLRSVSPGYVTNNGMDHSHGIGLTLGWRWNINKSLAFGLAYIKKSYVGRYKKYRGYEPYHAKNYIPQTIGGGFTYRFTQKIAGRIEVIWTGFGNLPNANNTILSNGKLNRAKRGSDKSSGSGLQDATFINLGLGYTMNKRLSFGAGLSHRIKLSRKSRYIISHSYMRQITYNLITLGINYNYLRHDIFLTASHGLKNRQSGYMPDALGGGKFTSEKQYNALSIAWGYLY